MTSPYTQLCIWEGIKLDPNDLEEIQNLERFFKDKGFRIKYLNTIQTLPDATGPGGRHDVFFYIHKNDIQKFAIFKLQIGARWWEDIYYNEKTHLYPSEFIKNHPKTW